MTGAGRNKVSGYYIRFLSSQWSAGIDGDFLREHCQGLKFFYQIYQATTRIFHITLIKFDEQHRSRVNLLHRTRGRLPYYWSSPSREEPAYGLISNVDSLCGRLGTASWIRIQQTHCLLCYQLSGKDARQLHIWRFPFWCPVFTCLCDRTSAAQRKSIADLAESRKSLVEVQPSPFFQYYHV